MPPAAKGAALSHRGEGGDDRERDGGLGELDVRQVLDDEVDATLRYATLRDVT